MNTLLVRRPVVEISLNAVKTKMNQESLSFIHTNSCTFLIQIRMGLLSQLKVLKTLYEALKYVSTFYEIIFREFLFISLLMLLLLKTIKIFKFF